MMKKCWKKGCDKTPTHRIRLQDPDNEGTYTCEDHADELELEMKMAAINYTPPSPVKRGVRKRQERHLR